MVIFLAGLQGVPVVYKEAAMLDGAGPVKDFFRHVTLPLLSGCLLQCCPGDHWHFSVLHPSLRHDGRRADNASLFNALYLFRNAFEYFKIGKASAMAWVLFAVLLAITAIQFGLSKRWVHYEGEKA